MYYSSFLMSIMFKVQGPEIVHTEARKPGVQQREVVLVGSQKEKNFRER